MIAIYIALAIVSIIDVFLLYRFAKPDGTLTVDESDPDNVKMELTGVNVLDGDQKYYILRVSRYKISRK